MTPTSSSLAGSLLGGAIRGVAAVRRPAKPLHPYGTVKHGRLSLRGPSGLGVPTLEGSGTLEVLVRVSRAVGLPHPAPDIHGIALRVPLPGGRYGDLLLASTGLGRATRFVLTGSRSWLGRPMTTLLPYRTPHGPVLLGARPLSEDRLELLWAPALGAWTPWAELTLLDEAAQDALVSFDAVLNELPGLPNYAWVRRLREPAYRAARRSRGPGRGD